MKTILISIPTIEYYRNYITSRAFGEIDGKLVFLVPESLAGKQYPGETIVYDYPKDKNVLHRHVFNINMARFKRRSTSFVFRFLRLRPRLQRIYRFLSLPLIAEAVIRFFLWRAHDEGLAAAIKNLTPSIILLPSSGYEGITFEIIKLAKRQKVPTFLLIDNWDNLYSKTIFTYQPDYLAVWGEQSVGEAWNIHRFPRERIFALGTPRFLGYRSPSPFPSPFPFRYAVFAGTSAGFDELSALKKLDELIGRRALGLTLVYRPHPARQRRKCPDDFVESEFKHVVLDIPARQYYYADEASRTARKEWPDLDYYPKLLANMEFMVCPLSTMLIEGLLFRKPIFVLAYDDGIHFTNPKNLYYYCQHFKGIEKLRGLELIHEFSDLDMIFRTDPWNKIIEKEIELRYFLSDAMKTYPETLARIVGKILYERPQ